MKYILLIMTILQIKSFWRGFKGIFSSYKKDKKEINSAIAKVEDLIGDKGMTNGLMILIGLLQAIFLSVYYILAGVKVGSLIFFLLSCVFIIRLWRSLYAMIKWLDNRDDSLIQRKFIDRVWSVAYLSYIGYLVYFLITTW